MIKIKTIDEGNEQTVSKSEQTVSKSKPACSRNDVVAKVGKSIGVKIHSFSERMKIKCDW